MDASLTMSDGSAYEHAFRHEGIASIVRRGLGRPVGVGSDTVFASELSVFVTGRYHRAASGFHVYWHSHSDLVFAMTGVTHCMRLYVECGKESDGRTEPVPVPNVYMTLGSVCAYERSTHSHGICIRWSPNVSISLVRRKEPILILIGTLNDARSDSIVSRTHDDVLKGLSRRIDYSHDVSDTRIFIEKISVAHKLLMSGASSVAPKAFLERCSMLAARRKLSLVSDNVLENFFLSQVCLYVLGEDNSAEEIIGVLYSRASEPDYAFRKHREAFINAKDLAMALNCIYDNKGSLLPHDTRLNENDGAVICARRYYARYTEVDNAVVHAGCCLINHFYTTWSVPKALAKCDFVLPRAHRVSMDDFISVLRI